MIHSVDPFAPIPHKIPQAAVRSLKELQLGLPNLAAAEEGVDIPLAHHHVILLGDLVRRPARWSNGFETRMGRLARRVNRRLCALGPG
jgi:hypothetical protein